MVFWSVSFETAAIERGSAPTQAEAERAASQAHDAYVIRGLNPDSLAYHTAPSVPCLGCGARFELVAGVQFCRVCS